MLRKPVLNESELWPSARPTELRVAPVMNPVLTSLGRHFAEVQNVQKPIK